MDSFLPTPTGLGFGALALFRPMRSWHKTDREMNALLRLFVNRPTQRALACVCGAALLSGCVASPFATTQVDPASPVAADVARMARASADYPSFSEIPPLPADQRPRRQRWVMPTCTKSSKKRCWIRRSPSSRALSSPSNSQGVMTL